MTGWHALTAAARKPTEALAQALDDPGAAQTALLAEILRTNAGSAFGQRYGFEDIRCVDDYRAAVPVSCYDDYRPFIQRIAAGEAGILTVDPVIAFEETGGTTSGGKLIPYTATSLRGFRQAALPWLADLLRRHPGVGKGTAYASISPATRPVTATSGGIPIGMPTEAAYLGDDVAGALLSIFAVPPAVASIHAVDAWRQATLEHLVASRELSFVSVWSPTFFLELIDHLPSLTETVADRLDPASRARLERSFQGSVPDLSHLWPNLAVISCWADGSSRVFAERLAACCPQAVVEPKGLFATEAAITLPWKGDPGAIPALTSTFIEFLDDSGSYRLAHELCEGQSYHVIITTAGGLYRYDMGDRVRCVAREGQVGRLVFEGRSSIRSDLVGEKLDEAFVAGVLGKMRIAGLLAAQVAPKPHYELWLDHSHDGNPGDLATEMDNALRRNPQYAYARDIDQLGPVVALAKPGFVTEHSRKTVQQGRRLGDLKPISLLPVTEIIK